MIYKQIIFRNSLSSIKRNTIWWPRNFLIPKCLWAIVNGPKRCWFDLLKFDVGSSMWACTHFPQAWVSWIKWAEHKLCGWQTCPNLQSLNRDLLTWLWIQRAGGWFVYFTANSIILSCSSSLGLEHIENPPTTETPGIKKSTLKEKANKLLRWSNSKSGEWGKQNWQTFN